MQYHPESRSRTRYHILPLALAIGLTLPLSALAGLVTLATSPLATSTTTSVKPNLLMVLDNSGSMDWDHMPDDSSDGGSSVTFVYGYYGVRSSQCNQVYYDPTITYQPPVHPDGTSYPDAAFDAACANGFSGTCSVNLNSGFQANQSGLSGPGSDTAGTAYYYNYSGSQTTQLQKNYNSTTNTFYNECRAARYASPGKDVFTKISLSKSAGATTATIVASCSSCTSTSVSSIKIDGAEIMSGTTTGSTTTGTVATAIAAQINLCTSAKVGNCSASGGHHYTATASGSTVTLTGLAATASSLILTQSGSMTFDRTIFPIANDTNLTNFANWYSYYRTRLLMMKTASGRAFGNLNANYRVGLMKISSSSAPTVGVDLFCDNTTTGCGAAGMQRTNWYTALYSTTTSGSTPLRTALSNAGRYFAGKLSTTDPIQYSCQQNFAILSTDGYWNAGDGYQMNGTTLMDNEDGTAGRPMNDGYQANTTVVTQYTRNSYAVSSSRIGSSGSNCSSGKSRLLVTPQTRSCTVTTPPGGAGTCTAWANGTQVYASPYTSSSSSCVTTATVTASVPSPNPNPTNGVVVGTPVTTTGGTGGTSNTLADVAMYYYQHDLRTGTYGSTVAGTFNNCAGAISGVDVCTNNVFTTTTDNNIQQHMTTFTLGLGASGWMNYSSSYLSDQPGATSPPCDSAPDYVAIKLGCPAKSSVSPPVCSWQADGTTCTWPTPGMSGTNGLIANIDDLWHAAVNGRGAYFSATNPTTLSDGLSNALASINAKRGSAAAAATSTLNPVAGNNYAYVASYTTVAWKGNLEARGINVDTGTVSVNASWCAENVTADTCASPSTVVPDTSGATTIYNCVTPHAVVCNGGTMVGADCYVPVATTCTGTMGAMVSTASDTRTIYTAPAGGLAPITGRNLVPFDAAYATANPSSFSAAHIGTLSQWTSLSSAQQTAAAGTNLINYLRGQYGYEDRTTNADKLYRFRETVLGDALESQPAFIGAPVFSYPYPGYSNFKTAYAGRAGTVYIGANDGMMHAFAADTGIERWAYVPSMVVPNLWMLADQDYATLHRNFVNGSPITSDVCTANCGDASTAVWKTILVAGLNGGGRGYYALDITDPSLPKLLWEFTTTAGIGAIKDDDLGYSFGQPIITTKADGTWVVLVTSGYNNTCTGCLGKGYLFVLNAGTGNIISKISTGVGSATTPSGLAKIAGWNDDPTGNRVGDLYGGDLLGNIWRFDINGSTAAITGTGDVMQFATLFSDTAGTSPQPITTTPILGLIDGVHYVFISTGKYLETSDLTTTQKQSLYSIRDNHTTSTIANPRLILTPQTLSPNPDGTATRLSSSNPVTAGGPGCYVDYPATGERANIDSKLVEGILIAPTIVPSNTACSPGGFGWLNYFNYKTCGATSVKSDSTIVGVNVIYVQGEPVVEIVTSTNPTPTAPALQPPFVPTPVSFSGKRTIWRELIP